MTYRSAELPPERLPEQLVSVGFVVDESTMTLTS